MTRDMDRQLMESPRVNGDVSLRHILIGTDFSPVADAAFAYAATIAEFCHAKLYVAHVINLEPLDLTDSESTPTIIKEAHQQAEEKINRLLNTWPLQTARSETIVAEGAIAEVLVDLLRRNHIDLAVLGTHGRRAFKKLLWGSIAEEVVRMAECPVLSISLESARTAKAKLRHVLYLLQLQPDSSEAAKYAVSLAQRFGANLTVMNVREDLCPSAAEEEKEQGIIEPFKYWIEDHIPEDSDLCNRVHFERGFGPTTKAILDFVSKTAVDLVVMSIERVDPVIAAHLPIADTANDLITRAPCPVLTIR